LNNIIFQQVLIMRDFKKLASHILS